MYFTKEDFKKIEEYLKYSSMKDTDFDLVDLLTSDDLLAFVLNDKNVIAKLSTLRDLILNKTVSWDSLLDSLLNIIASSKEGGIALAGETGNSELIGIHLKKLTEMFNAINQYVSTEVGDIHNIIGDEDEPGDTLINRIGGLETLVGGSGEGSVNERIANAKAEILGDAAGDYNTLGKVEDKIQEEVARATAEETELSIYVHAIEGGNIRVKTSTPNTPDTGAPANTVYRVAGTTTYSDYMWNGTTMVKMAEYNVDTLESQFGYYKWETASNTISITTSNQVAGSPIGSYVLTSGGSFKIKMTNKATGACTLNMNDTGAKTLLYNGNPIDSSNTWEDGEVISVYYDGTNYQATNAQGGGGNAEKIKYDNSQSGLAATDVQGALDETNILNESENLFDVTTAESNNPSSVYYLVTFDTANITTTVSTRIKITENGIAGGIKCTWMEVGAIYKFDLDYTNNISGASIKKDSYTSNTLAVGSGHLSFTVRNNGGTLLVNLPKNTAASKSCVISNLSITKIDYLKDTVNDHEERLGGVELKTIADVPVDFIGNTQTISYYIATQSGYWIASSSSYPYYCKILQIQTNTNYRLTAENDNPVSYALLTNNTPHTDNVQATNWNGGVPASLAAGESVVINSGEYTYLYCRNNNGSTASDFKYPQKIEQLEPVDKAVEKNIDAIALLNSAVISEPLVIPYGSMTYNNGFISPSQKKWVTGTGYEHYYFARTSDMKEISVKGKSGTYTYISFLQSYNYVGTPSGTPVFCAGYDAPRQFFETSTPQDTVKIPSDCNYIVVNISYPGTSQLPEAVYIGYDLKDAVVYKNNVNSTFHIPMEVGYIATDTGVNPIFSGDAGTSNGYAYSTTEGEFRYWRNVGLIDVDGGEYTISFDNGDLCSVFFYDYLRNFIKVVYYGTTEDVSSVTINANGAKYLRIVIMTKADTYAQDQRLDIMPNPNAIINGVFIGGLKISKLKKQNTNPADTIITPVWIENTFASLDSTQEVQDDGEWHIDYGRLALPPNYDPDGEPVRLIIYSHGGNPRYNPVFNGDSSYTYVTGDFSRTNHIDPTLFLKEGYAVMDMDACFAIFNVKDIEGVYIINGRQVANCYQAAYDYVIRNYNIRTDGVLLGGLSFGSERSLQIITWSNIPILAAALHSPYVGEPRFWSIGYRKPLSKHAGFTDYDDVAIGNINAAQLALLEENYPKLLRTSPIFAMCHVSKEDFFATHTIDIGGVSTQVSLLDGYVNWGTYVVSTWAAHFNVPIKMWAGTADTTAIIAQHAAILYSVGINGGSDIILRIVNGAKHVPTVGSDIITIPSYVTKYGETLTNVSMIYVETLRYWRRYEQK